jgi:hypothetical protein
MAAARMKPCLAVLLNQKVVVKCLALIFVYWRPRVSILAGETSYPEGFRGVSAPINEYLFQLKVNKNNVSVIKVVKKEKDEKYEEINNINNKVWKGSTS